MPKILTRLHPWPLWAAGPWGGHPPRRLGRRHPGPARWSGPI